MERPAAMGISGDMGAVNEVMRHDPHFRSLGARTTARWMDTPAAGDKTGMSSSSITFHPCGRRISGVHDAT